MNFTTISPHISTLKHTIRNFYNKIIQQRGADITEGFFLFVVWYHFVSQFIGTNHVQAGDEYMVHIISLQNWTNAQVCGLCMMWGNSVGGMPVFADPYGAFQHPLVMITTLLFGPLHAANITLAVAIFVLGFSGYLFCTTYQLHRIVRVWITVTMIYGGLIAGRIVVGSISLPLSLSFATFSFVYFLVWANNPTRKNAILLSIIVSMLLVSGQGYMQIAFVMTLIPMSIYLYALKKPNAWAQVPWMIALVSALIAPFLLTFGANSASFGKDTDITLSSMQHIGFIMLNFIVDNLDFYNTPILGRAAAPYLYSNFIGYPIVLGAFVSVILAVIQHPFVNKLIALIYVISSSVVVILVLASGDVQHWIIGFNIAPLTQFVIGLRNLTLVASYAGALLVLLAALCGDILIRQLYPSIALIRINRWVMKGRSHWLVVVVMIWHVLTLYAYNKQFYLFSNQESPTLSAAKFLQTQPIGGINVEANYQIFDIMQTQKKMITQMFYPWFIINTSSAGTMYQLKSAPPEDMTTWQEIKRIDATWAIYKSTDINQQYALHTSENGTLTPCNTQGTGGDMDVWCTVSTNGILRIYENNLGSWQAWVDGVPTNVISVNKFVAVPVTTGAHHIVFRYRPWYTMLGLLLSWSTWFGLISWGVIAVVQQIRAAWKIPAVLDVSHDAPA
jgi:hypothetical protein